MNVLSHETLALPIHGTGLRATTLGELVRDPKLLVFLRHGG